MADLLAAHPDIRSVRLDVQQRNASAVAFYSNLGFTVVSEERQPVDGEAVPYYTMELSRRIRS